MIEANGRRWIDAEEGARRFGFRWRRSFRRWALEVGFPRCILPHRRGYLYDLDAIERVFHATREKDSGQDGTDGDV